MTIPAVDIAELHEAILTAITGKFPLLAQVIHYPRQFEKVTTPACWVDLEQMETVAPDPGTEQTRLQLRWSAIVIVGGLRKDGAGLEPRLSVRVLAAAVAHFINRQRWGVAGCGPAKVQLVMPDAFDPRLDNYECWRIEWTQEVMVGDDIWNLVGTIPSEIWSADTPLGKPLDPTKLVYPIPDPDAPIIVGIDWMGWWPFTGNSAASTVAGKPSMDAQLRDGSEPIPLATLANDRLAFGSYGARASVTPIVPGRYVSWGGVLSGDIRAGGFLRLAEHQVAKAVYVGVNPYNNTCNVVAGGSDQGYATILTQSDRTSVCLAAVLDRQTLELRVYVDGVYAGSRTVSGGDVPTNPVVGAAYDPQTGGNLGQGPYYADNLWGCNGMMSDADILKIAQGWVPDSNGILHLEGYALTWKAAISVFNTDRTMAVSLGTNIGGASSPRVSWHQYNDSSGTDCGTLGSYVSAHHEAGSVFMYLDIWQALRDGAWSGSITIPVYLVAKGPSPTFEVGNWDVVNGSYIDGSPHVSLSIPGAAYSYVSPCATPFDLVKGVTFYDNGTITVSDLVPPASVTVDFGPTVLRYSFTDGSWNYSPGSMTLPYTTTANGRWIYDLTTTSGIYTRRTKVEFNPVTRVRNVWLGQWTTSIGEVTSTGWIYWPDSSGDLFGSYPGGYAGSSGEAGSTVQNPITVSATP